MLLNLSNHPSEFWPEEQKRTAQALWGTVQDMPFPVVNPEADTREIQQQAEQLARKAVEIKPAAVLCQGEMTMALALVYALQKQGISVYAATSCRECVEVPLPQGGVERRSVFRFVQFRKYADTGDASR